MYSGNGGVKIKDKYEGPADVKGRRGKSKINHLKRCAHNILMSRQFVAYKSVLKVKFEKCSDVEFDDGKIKQSDTDEGDWNCGLSTKLLPKDDQDRGLSCRLFKIDVLHKQILLI